MRRQRTASFRVPSNEYGSTHAADEAIRAAGIFERILHEIESRDASVNDTLTRLARESFAAGFAAALSKAAREYEEPPESSQPEPAAVTPSLANLVGNLSPRRLEVLRLVARGLTNREIAQVLGISSNTVKAHLAGVLEALDLSNRTEAALALREYEVQQADSPSPVRLIRTARA